MSDSKMDAMARMFIASGNGARISALREFVLLALKVGMLLTAILASAFAILVFFPDGTDYAQVTVKKNHRLAQYDTRKIVLVGGSNLSFGIDSARIRQATGCPVVNMGVNGHLGVRYMLEEVRTRLKPSDIVVLSFELDSFYKSVEGAAPDLLATVKAYPPAFNYLSHAQKVRVIAAIPAMVQNKSMRVISEFAFSIKKKVTGSAEGYETEKSRIFWRVVLNPAGTTVDGDVISHLNLPWPYPLTNGHIPKDAPIEAQMISLVRDFAAEMMNRGVTVLMSYSPVERKFYDRHQKEFSDVHKLISVTRPLITPSPPSDFAYPERHFFDTVYHLNAEGRSVRTQKLIEDLKSQLQESIYCPQTNAVSAATK